MKKQAIIISFLAITTLLIGTNLTNLPNVSFDRLQRDLEKQAAKFKDSDLHREIKQNRASRSYEIGDQETFWRWNLSVMPPTWVQTQSTCRAVGEHCYLFVANDQWNVHMDENDVETVMFYLEQETMAGDDFGAIEMDTLHFGPIPDELDNDPKLIVFYSALGSFQGSVFDGYFSVYNEVTEAEAQQMNPPGHSNECEMIYMTCYPLNPTDPVRISVLSHELQHMIHWAQDDNEDTWLNEGMSELAMVYFGMPDPISGFNSNPDNSLIVWNQQFSDYVKTMLYFTYLEEHYDDGSLIKDIVSEPLNSISGISNQLTLHETEKNFNEIFVDWTIANFLDEPETGNGLYNYEELNLPNFSTVATYSNYPASGGGNINPWAAEYVRLYHGENNLHVLMEANQNIHLGVIRKGAEGIVSEVDIFPVDNLLDVDLPDFSDDYSQMILVISNDSNVSVNYSFTVSEVETFAEESEFQRQILLNCFPNPFRNETTISFESTAKDAKNAKIEIYNVKGEKIKSFSIISERGTIIWNGTDEFSKRVKSGVYFLQFNLSEKVATKKIIYLD